jgi:hypothetical protein
MKLNELYKNTRIKLKVKIKIDIKKKIVIDD